jgi:hypothetical protein
VRWCAPCHRRNRLGPSRPSPVLFSVLPSESLTGYDPTHYVRSGLVQRVLQYVTIDAHLSEPSRAIGNDAFAAAARGP